MLKYLIYIFAFWFFFRVARRLFTFWLIRKSHAHHFPGKESGKKNIKDLEEAEYVEIEEPKS
jgi:hypothetical protein